jgi:hypothetical protein
MTIPCTRVEVDGFEETVVPLGIHQVHALLGEPRWVPVLQFDVDDPEDEDNGARVSLGWLPLDRPCMLSEWVGRPSEREALALAIGRAIEDPDVADFYPRPTSPPSDGPAAFWVGSEMDEDGRHTTLHVVDADGQHTTRPIDSP